MSENQSGQHLPEPSPLGSSKKPDSQLRLVGTDEDVAFPEDAPPTDSAPTIISKPKLKSLQNAFTTDTLLFAGKNLRGQRLAHFELMEPIGVGGMAAVIRARDTQLDRFVALKILPPDMAVDFENVRRFHQEARSAAKLDHENIARVFFCGEDRNLHFIAFEFVEGDNLRTILEQRGPLPVAEAIRIILQVASGLEHAASRGVVHRDIKPSNIIVSSNGRAKLVDMGLARSQLPHGAQALTQSGMTLGTFDYISPEQALEPREADVRSDIYSLGCTFYHMLTGQPPVPEGTAAKKLYHHQHLAPIDPRQLNPSIPDEVAAILMRMMAKDPKDRYQRPVHLVHHLMQVAEKIGIGVGIDVPEGAIFPNSPLPSVPRFGPLITIALAVLALGVLLLLLSLLAPTPRRTIPKDEGGRMKDEAPKDEGGRIKTKDEGGKIKAESPNGAPDSSLSLPPSSLPIEKREQLSDALRNEKLSDAILLVQDINLGEGGLHYNGTRNRKIKSANPESLATLRFVYQPGDKAPGLTILGEGQLSFEKIRFVVEYSGAPTVPWSEIVVRGPGRATFDGCEFVQVFSPPPGSDSGAGEPPVTRAKPNAAIASVTLENLSQLPHVVLKNCYFQQGQIAVALQGQGDVQARDCAFGPHDTLFHLRESNRDKAAKTTSKLVLDHCSAFLVQGPAFRLDGNHGCTLTVGSSIFSCPDPSSGAIDKRLILQTYAQAPIVKYQGTRNVYHGLNGLWSWPDGKTGKIIKTDPEEFRGLPGCNDKDSVVLRTFPWAEAEPLNYLDDPKRAFQVDGNSADLRTPDSDGRRGVERCSWGRMDPLPRWTSREPPSVFSTANEMIVETGKDDPEHGVFSSLSKALAAIKPGPCKILIKRDPKKTEISVKLDLDDPKWDLTIESDPYVEAQDRPILVLSETTKDAAMTRLIDGRVHFENLEFLLDPKDLDFKSQTVVALGGNGTPSFKNCAFTLRQPERHTSLSVVSLWEREDVKPAPATKQPRVVMENCVVRGEGDLVNVRSSRPFDLKFENSLFALSGSLLVVQSASHDADFDKAALARLHMFRVSAFLTEPCIILHGGKNMYGLVKTQCEPMKENLIVSLASKPFLVLEGIGLDRDMLPRYFQWKGEGNAYVNLPENVNMLEGSRVKLDNDDWRALESDATFLQAQFTLMPLGSRTQLSQMNVDQFKPRPESAAAVANFGANLDADMLPRFGNP